jgi:hypothetical protein
MPALSSSQIPPPANWQDFESLCCDLWRAIWRDPGTQKNGRSGQIQSGVDISGRPQMGDEWAGVQCKGKDNYAEKRVTQAELRAEVEKAEKFIPKLSQFILATTGPKDTHVEQLARVLTKDHLRSGGSSVTVLGWRDILLLLENNRDVVAKHYPWIQAVSWQVEALRASEFLSRHLTEAHCGAVLWCPFVTAVFSNRRWTQIERVRQHLQQLGLKELGAHESKESDEWAILVESDRARELCEIPWEHYRGDDYRVQAQKTIAYAALYSNWDRPIKQHCAGL